MTPTFEVGEVAVWQNLAGEFQHLNGCETTVIALDCGGNDPYTGEPGSGWLTDSVWCSRYLVAVEGELRKKRPPEADDAAARQAMLDCIERAKIGQGATV